LRIRGLSESYIVKVGELLFKYVASQPVIAYDSAASFLVTYSDRKPNTRARYATYLRGFLSYLGIPFDLKVRVPKSLPAFVRRGEIDKLIAVIKNKRTQKGGTTRDLLLIETAIKTGLRRSELANLRVRDIDFEASRLKVVNGKGAKDRVVPLHTSLAADLEDHCRGKQPETLVFGLSPHSLGMKVYTWAKKANVAIHAHSFRHYFATTLVDKGANIRAVQELLGHTNLNTTQVYLSVTGRHLEEAINLLD